VGCRIFVFDADSPPDMRCLRRIAQGGAEESAESFCAFREDLVRVPVHAEHDGRDCGDVLVRDVVLEEVAHAVDEHGFRTRPLQWLQELAGDEAEVESLLVRVTWDVAEAFSEGFRVAVRASRADLGAATYGVPPGVRPLDFGLETHRGPIAAPRTFSHVPVSKGCPLVGRRSPSDRMNFIENAVLRVRDLRPRGLPGRIRSLRQMRPRLALLSSPECRPEMRRRQRRDDQPSLPAKRTMSTFGCDSRHWACQQRISSGLFHIWEHPHDLSKKHRPLIFRTFLFRK
jgi:hypothetical protein